MLGYFKFFKRDKQKEEQGNNFLMAITRFLT